jgi:choice-of-anchor B domain-containing protein
MSYYKLIITSFLLIGSTVLAHDDIAFREDRIGPYQGKGFRYAQGGTSPIDFPSSGVQLLGWLPLVELDPAATSGDDCWGYVSPSGREYALLGISTGTAFIEVSQPDDPQLLTVIAGPNSIWRDIKVYLDHAYAVSEGGQGIQVFDLSGIDSGVVTYVGDVTAAGSLTTSQSHNVVINEQTGYLYRLGGGSGTIGVRVYDLSNPSAPAYVAEWHDRYVHDAQFITMTTGPFAGQEIAFLFSNTQSSGGTPGLDIVNFTDKSNIQNLSFTTYSNNEFSHQGWLTTDEQYIYLNDEKDEDNGLNATTTTRIIDVSDLTSPTEVGTFTSGLGAIDHNLYIKGDLVFEANYRSGLRIFDASNPIAPVEVAFFDTWPQDDNPDFNGLWSNYPYLPSGIILGSDIEKGLFVWWLGDPLLSFSYPGGTPALIAPGGTSLQVNVIQDSPGDLEPGTATLHYSTGGAFVGVPFVPQGGDLHLATIPELPCGTIMEYYVSAESTNGIAWKNPQGAPGTTFTATIAESVQLVDSDSMEADDGWQAGAPGDSASTGAWVRVNPLGTIAQPDADHSDFGSDCWVTGQGTGRGAGENDVDSGFTTLVSAEYDLTGFSMPSIEYWRWYSNSAGGAPNEDAFVVDISNNGGGSWTNVETVGPAGEGTSGGWVRYEFVVDEIIPPTSQIVLRFIAEDGGSPSLVEAAIDDLSINDIECGCEFAISHADIVPVGGDGVVDLDDIMLVTQGFVSASPDPVADLFPCAGDGAIDMDDILSVLAAYAGTPQCEDICLD